MLELEYSYRCKLEHFEKARDVMNDYAIGISHFTDKFSKSYAEHAFCSFTRRHEDVPYLIMKAVKQGNPFDSVHIFWTMTWQKYSNKFDRYYDLFRGVTANLKPIVYNPIKEITMVEIYGEEEKHLINTFKCSEK